MAYAMVTQFGFSKKIGQVNYSNMGDGMNKPYSEETGREIDSEVKAIIGKYLTLYFKFLFLSR
jgi:AFG3 family protein